MQNIGQRKKRLIVELDPWDYKAIKEAAGLKDMTVSNYVRHMLDLPLERQGVKRAVEPPKRRAKR